MKTAPSKIRVDLEANWLQIQSDLAASEDYHRFRPTQPVIKRKLRVP